MAVLLYALRDLPPEQTLAPLAGYWMIRALALSGVAFVVGLVLGRPIINQLRAHKIGKQIRIDGPQSHMVKMGTPTMGGIIFLVTIVLSMLLMNVPHYRSLLLPLGVIIACGLLGAIDDRLSIVGGKNRRGLTARFKMLWLLAIGGVVAYVLYVLLDLHRIYIPFSGNQFGTDIGWLYVPIVILVFVGTANSVNLSDGLDTQASGMAAMAFVAYGVIAYSATAGARPAALFRGGGRVAGLFVV